MSYQTAGPGAAIRNPSDAAGLGEDLVVVRHFAARQRENEITNTPGLALVEYLSQRIRDLEIANSLLRTVLSLGAYYLKHPCLPVNVVPAQAADLSLASPRQ
ncbi:MAG TPA: hypothetical protein VEW46_00685 [Pyrinomonadaceae bacterium]|nr:hypothetical protein [Pyrinomonadaceae bacterium]